MKKVRKFVIHITGRKFIHVVTMNINNKQYEVVMEIDNSIPFIFPTSEFELQEISL